MSEKAPSDDSGSINDEIDVLVSEGNRYNLDSVFETYDANLDGRIGHSEYVAVHKSEVKNGGISGVIDRLLDDSPELRGQRLWVMFALSVLLVAAMNAYAMVREPELVNIEDLIEHNREVVTVEGIVISWVEDPYSSGDNRIDIIIEDDTGVAELRWYRYGDVPMLGTQVTATGDVIEYEGRIWLQALGGGALSWEKSDIPETPVIGISTIAANPSDFLGKTFTITGYLSKSVKPDSTFMALYLGDHPVYSNSEHQMRMVINSAPGQWLEAGQKVEVTAVVQYEQRELRWSIHAQGPEIRIDRNHIPEPSTIVWANYQTWSYSEDQYVILAGIISGDKITEPGGDLKACLLNSGNISSFEGSEVAYGGRLIWSQSHSSWCIDTISQPIPTSTLLLQLASNPEQTLVDISNFNLLQLTAYVSGSVEMSKEEGTKISIANAIYSANDPGNLISKMDAFVPLGMHTGWLEDGQEIIVNVTVKWEPKSSEFQLDISSLEIIGEPPSAQPYDLSKGAPEFWDLNKITEITGNLVTIDGLTYLQKEGGIEKIRINVTEDSIGLNEYHEEMTLKWTGRLIEVADDVTLAHHYVLDEADVTDEDGNGIADDAEDF